MDQFRADYMAKRLNGSWVEEWQLTDYLNNGKSAIVFRGRNNHGKNAAVKLFDPEIVDRYGDHQQLGRINREKQLIGQHHPNLIEIYGGGKCHLDNQDFYYITMEYLDLDNLKNQLDLIPFENIWSLIAKVAAAADFLERNDLCHRDIKPENIVCDATGSKVKLLDLGVLRPISGSDLTDDQGRPFIATLRYSSPEYLLREEEDSLEGWRALTFYQLGGVLHDLIMRIPLFQDFEEPFVRLSNAIQHVTPTVISNKVPSSLLALARNCLIKDPNVRLQAVSWSDFQPRAESGGKQMASIMRRMIARKKHTVQPRHDTLIDRNELLKRISEQIREALRHECLNGYFPRQLFKGPEQEESNSFRLVLDFARSAEESLRCHFKIIFWVSFLAERDDAILINASNLLSKEDMEIPSDLAVESVYRGVFMENEVISRLMPYVFTATDLAQSHPDPDENWPYEKEWTTIEVESETEIQEL